MDRGAARSGERWHGHAGAAAARCLCACGRLTRESTQDAVHWELGLRGSTRGADPILTSLACMDACMHMIFELPDGAQAPIARAPIPL